MNAPVSPVSIHESGVARASATHQRQERIREAIEAGDAKALRENSALPESIADEILHLYERPGEVNKWQNQLHKTFDRLFKELVFGLTVPRERADRFLHQLFDVLEREPKVFSLFAQPDDADRYLFAHAVNTVVLALLIGRDREEPVLRNLLFSASLADVGMAVIPESLYLKEGELTNRGRSAMAKHPLYARRIATRIFGGDQPVPRLVGEHHEGSDGRGYPRRLPAKQQHPLASVLACADTYTAMIEERPFRGAMASDRAFQEVTEEAFPEGIVRVLEEEVGPYPNGSLVQLTDERVALVQRQTDSPREPGVMVLTDEKRRKLDRPERLDLQESNRRVRTVLKN